MQVQLGLKSVGTQVPFEHVKPQAHSSGGIKPLPIANGMAYNWQWLSIAVKKNI